MTANNKNHNENKFIKAISIVLWLTIGLYLGVAGWVKFDYDTLVETAMATNAVCDPNDPRYDPNHTGIEYRGVEFCSVEDILAMEQYELSQNLIFGWSFQLPTPLPLIISASAFGIVGSVIRMLRGILNKKALPDTYTLYIAPLMGALTALLILGISYLLPSALTIESNILLRPTSQLFVSLFAGAFSEQIFKWLQNQMDKVFKTEKEKI